VKRRLKEIGRTEILPRLGAAGLTVDVLVRARREAYGATFAELRDELARLAGEVWCDGS
jgi:RNase P protein component